MRSQNQSKRESSMRETVKSVLFRRGGVTTIVECRRCGTTIDDDESDCPACDCDDIVTYRLQ